MSKQIFCNICSTQLGELASGTKIKKGTVFLCASCNSTVKLWKEMAQKYQPGKDNPLGSSDYLDKFGDIFGDLFKGGNT